MVITRFAPSPTGELHIGGARTALFAFLFARHNKGRFLLRIEDTDRERYVEGSVGRIIDALNWLGIVPDNNDSIMIQSTRLNLYKKHALELVEAGHAYICTCSKEKLAADRERQMQEKKPPRHDGHCRNLRISPAAVAGAEFVIRMKMPDDAAFAMHDLIRGDITFDLSLFDDQILLKSDGYPTYHLASVVDDHDMSITHVIRAEEWLPSTPKHILLYRMFGWDIPAFAHLPMILAPDRSKLSKRHGATGVFEYKQLGYLPEAILNFIALLGWHLSEDTEIFSLDQLVKNFTLERVQKSGAVFDVKKLNWLNHTYLVQKTPEALFRELAARYGEKEIVAGDREATLRLLAAGKERMEKLSDYPAIRESFSLHQYTAEKLLGKKKLPVGEVREHLVKIRETINSLTLGEFNQAGLEAAIMPYADAAGRGAVLWPLRVSLSGEEKSPGPFEIMYVIGKEESLRRIGSAIAKLDE